MLQTYVADIFLAQSWRDHRLRLPENMTEEYRHWSIKGVENIKVYTVDPTLASEELRIAIFPYL